MTDGTFVDQLQKAMAAPKVVIVEGKERLLVPHPWTDCTPKPPVALPLQVGTLTGFVDYLKSNVDELVLDTLLVHVKDPNTVELRAKIEGEDMLFRRQTYLIASTEMVGGKSFFGQYLDAESFFVWLQSGFVATPELLEILTLIASTRDSKVLETTDDGVAQKVQVAMGVAFVGQKAVPNPVTLAPFRTFREVEQPASLFVLRLRSGKEGERPSCALFESDGGYWRLDAILRIAAYLRGKLAGLPMVLG
jgi:hypothetical protein